jgi:hypothetical protein
MALDKGFAGIGVLILRNKSVGKAIGMGIIPDLCI